MAKHPQAIKDVLAQLMARRGYARERSGGELTEAWQAAAGDLLAQHTRIGEIKRGTLEVFVANSTILQELTFQKVAVLDKLKTLAPDQPIKALRFKVGVIA